jgi:hypothetical protein
MVSSTLTRGRWLFVLALLCGCGPLSYLTHSTLNASHAVEEAKKSNAEALAPYEYTHAAEYLHKSRELAGFSHWMVSVEFAKKSAEMGHLAQQLAETRAIQGRQTGGGPTRPHEERRE